VKQAVEEGINNGIRIIRYMESMIYRVFFINRSITITS